MPHALLPPPNVRFATEAINDDGDVFNVIDVLAREVGVIGIFSDWPATVTFYANCMGIPAQSGWATVAAPPLSAEASANRYVGYRSKLVVIPPDNSEQV